MKNFNQYITEKIKLSNDRFNVNVSPNIKLMYDLFKQLYDKNIKQLALELKNNDVMIGLNPDHWWESYPDNLVQYTLGTFPIVMFDDYEIVFVDCIDKNTLAEIGYDAKTIISDTHLSMEEWEDLKQQIIYIFKAKETRKNNSIKYTFDL
jgi:hypothetical protein